MKAIVLTPEECNHVWKLLKRAVGGDGVEECPETGEAWQYMGTFEESDGVELSEFRHRSLHRYHWANSRRVIVRIRRFTKALPHGSWNAEMVTADNVTGDRAMVPQGELLSDMMW